jgi:hypothetical protein
MIVELAFVWLVLSAPTSSSKHHQPGSRNNCFSFLPSESVSSESRFFFVGQYGWLRHIKALMLETSLFGGMTFWKQMCHFWYHITYNGWHNGSAWKTYDGTRGRDWSNGRHVTTVRSRPMLRKGLHGFCVSLSTAHVYCIYGRNSKLGSNNRN